MNSPIVYSRKNDLCYGHPKFSFRFITFEQCGCGKWSMINYSVGNEKNRALGGRFSMSDLSILPDSTMDDQRFYC